MVCFDVYIAFSLYRKDSANLVNLKRLDHLAKHYVGDIRGMWVEDNYQHCRILLCDEDAVGFLRDVPDPVFAYKIQLLHKNTALYSNYKWSKQSIRPPQDPLLKKVFWMASSLERRFYSSFQRIGM